MNLANRSDIVFIRILLPYALSIIVFYDLANFTLIKWLAPVSTIFFCCLVSTNLFYQKLEAYKFKGYTGLVFYLFWFSFGGLCSVAHNQLIYSGHFANLPGQYMKIIIADEPQLKNNVVIFKSLVTNKYETEKINNIPFKTPGPNTPVSGKLLVTIKTDPLNPISLKYGDELVIPAVFSKIGTPNNPSEFDYRSWLAAQNIYHKIYLGHKQFIRLNNSGNPVISRLLQLRAQQVAFYRKVLKNNEAFVFASVLILGYKADLSQKTLDIYSKTGTIHALSVSGMHVGLIYLVLNLILHFLDRKQLLSILKTALILMFIWFYALLTGFSPSVLRSAIMITIFIVAKSFSRNTNNYNIIAFSAFCLLLYDPFLIWDVGFQLSFLAVTGLAWIQPKIQNWWHIENKWLNKIWSAVAMSLAAQLITYPLSIYYFHQFPVYFLISNLFIALPMALMMYLGIIILIGRFGFLVPAFEWLINFTNSGLTLVTKMPFASLQAIWISKTELILLCFTLALFILACSHFKKSLLFTSFISMVLLQSLLTYDKLIARQQKKVIIFSLPHNHAIAFISAKTAILLTDLDPTAKNFKYSVQPALDQHKIDEITFISGKRDTTARHFTLKGNNIIFYNHTVSIAQLQNKSSKVSKAWLKNLD